MKSLNNYIQENFKFKINRNTQGLKYKPENINELKQEINRRAKEIAEQDINILNCSDIDISAINKRTTPFNAPLYQVFGDVYTILPSNKLITLDVTDWDVRDIERLDCVFFDGRNFKEIIGLNTWDIRDAKDFSGMFSQCYALEHLDLRGWHIDNAVTFHAMFYDCKNLEEIQGIDYWDIKDQTTSNMFYGCSKLNDIGDIEHWELDNYSNRSKNMFLGCKKSIIPTWYKWK